VGLRLPTSFTGSVIEGAIQSGPDVPAIPTARAGDRYRTWNYGLRSKARDGEHRTVTTRRFDDTGRYVVLVAHEGRRLVGSTVFYFVDTLDDEQTDIHEIVGTGSIGPFFAEGDERWGGHAIVMDSVWVAPDRRRAGIATAMVELVAQIGLPGWGEFRDPWFAAFFLHHWPPTRSMHEGSYWPVYEAYEDVVEWANDEADEVDVNVTVWLSDSERLEWDAIHRDHDPKLLLDSQLRSHDETRSSLANGGWELEVRDARIERAGDGGWRITGTVRVVFAPEPLFARADLEAFLAAPFDASEPFEDLSDALAATVIATARRHAPREHARIEHWQLARPATRS
jgi:GNAT superfamily N-acetyltransferase